MPVSQLRFLLVPLVSLPLFACGAGQSPTESILVEQQIQEIRISLTEEKIENLRTQVGELNRKISVLLPDEGQAPESMKPGEKKASSGGGAASGVNTTAPGPERRAYDQALRSSQSGDHKKAETLFTDFLQKYPQSALAPNAEYWLGESYYSQKRYGEAILSFQNVVNSYPKHGKAPAALLKAGYSYERIGDNGNATFYLEQLIDAYPNSEPAPLARRVLQRLRS